MCGICGALSASRPLEADRLAAMVATLVHRGPDDEGSCLDGPVALGVRRLSIIDVEGGGQPIANEDGTVHVVQNGEIYNHVELREKLERRGHRFRTRCDTEVLVHLYEEHGEDFLAHLVGMFAIALWDAPRRRLLLARDRLGQKPLYYSRTGSRLVFGSEIKAVLAAGDASRELDPAALGEYLAKLYVSGAATVYRDVRQLPPAHLLIAEGDSVSVKRYWDPWAVAPRAGKLDEAELVEELGALLREAVRLRLRSDVPLGCFLSGGLDSSVVAALACEISSNVKTFTVGFEHSDYDESSDARAVAEHLGTEHHEYRLDCAPDELVDSLTGMFDQPFGDSSAVPTYYLSRAVRREVTVALSGDGGDEVFGGYPRYLARRLAGFYNRLPDIFRRGADGVARSLGGGGGRYVGGLRGRLRAFTTYARQTLERPEATRLDYFKPEMQADLLRPETWEVVRDAAGQDHAKKEGGGLDPVDYVMRRDLVDYLPDDILVKVDRASMAVSLEARAPLLDHRVVEFMLSLPAEWKLRGASGKYLLRRLAGSLLPRRAVRKRKHGFALPLHDWFRAGGRGRARLEALSSAGGPLGELVRPEAVSDLLKRHSSGSDLGEHLWSLLVLGLWLGENHG